MNTDDVAHIAQLARLDLNEDEKKEFTDKLESIVGFIDTVKQFKVSEEVIRDMHNYNTFRSDDRVHVAGESASEIIANMPAREENQLRVKKVLPN